MINILNGIDSTSSALNAERIRMEVVSQNIANVNSTRGPDGKLKPYQRQQVVFETALKDQLKGAGLPGSEASTVRVRASNRRSASRAWSTSPAMRTRMRTAWSRCRTSTSTRRWWT